MATELFYDDGGRGWSVTEPASNGGDREFPAILPDGFDESTLDKSQSYECECHRNGENMVVTKIGEVA